MGVAPLEPPHILPQFTGAVDGTRQLAPGCIEFAGGQAAPGSGCREQQKVGQHGSVAADSVDWGRAARPRSQVPQLAPP